MITCKFENGNENSLRHVTVDTLVFKRGRLLLVKRTKKLLEGGKWGLVGGFVERDETTKQAVEREVLEETGFKVRDIVLLRIKDDPNRPKEDRQNISFVYTANVLKKVGRPDNESDDIGWFDLSGLPPEKDFAFDHYQDIKYYLKYLNS